MGDRGGTEGSCGVQEAAPGNGAAADLDIAPRRRGRHRYMADTLAVHVVRSQGIVPGAPYTGRCREHGHGALHRQWCSAQRSSMVASGARLPHLAPWPG